MQFRLVDNNSTIKVFGAIFHGVRQLREYANSGEANDGVFVGEDYLHYPCFDSDDYYSEYRFYSNFVFARSKQELSRKMSMLKRLPGRINHRKISANTPEWLEPMAYYEGDTRHPLEISICPEVEIL